MNIFTKISQLTKLTDNEKLLVDFILSHPEKVMMMNAKELALQTYVSQTTVYRLCNKLELSNFSDLKVLIATQKKDFEKEFGPLLVSDSENKVPFQWVQGPWPWEYQC